MQTQPVEPRHTGHDEEQRHYIAGLLAGLSLVGRPRDMHALMERMAQAEGREARVNQVRGHQAGAQHLSQ